jgi:hypothetical protein
MVNINEMQKLLYNIDGLMPHSNSKLTGILGLNCNSRSGYITRGLIHSNNSKYNNLETSNIITTYNEINKNVSFDNKNSLYDDLINKFKNNVSKFTTDLYNVIAQQTNRTIRQCDIKKKLPFLQNEQLNDKDNFIFNFMDLMISSNMLKTWKEGSERLYKIDSQLEYIQPSTIYSKLYASKYEAMVADYLTNNNIPFVCQKTYPECKNINCLRFDFCVNYNDTEILVEYNGIQHYEPVSIFGGELALQKTQKNDNIKYQYTKDENIPLIVIPHNKRNRKEITNFLDEEFKKVIN